MDIRKRLKEIEESLPGDLPDIKIAERYKESVEKVGNVDKLLNAFEKIKDLEVNYFDFYEKASEKLNSINYSLKDIEDLCSVIEGDEYKIGIYISAAINKIIKDGEEVRLNFGNRKINFLGMYLSRGKVIVEGDAGNFVGHEMKGGSIYIKGDARFSVGIRMEGGNINIKGNARDYVGREMKDGSINIEGNVGDYVGHGMKGGSINIKRNAGNEVGGEMKNGSIIVEGNVGDYVGDEMNGGNINIKGNVGDYVGYSSEGGEIWIEGNYKRIGKSCKAKIYHKGKLIKC